MPRQEEVMFPVLCLKCSSKIFRLKKREGGDLFVHLSCADCGLEFAVLISLDHERLRRLARTAMRDDLGKIVCSENRKKMLRQFKDLKVSTPVM